MRFAAEDGFRYENPATGTRVHIPAYALTYADGQSVSGEVDFELREYRSLADFAASGMPMHYVDGRGEFFFNSGGMFDVRVSQRGEALQLAPGQGCDLRFRSTHALTQASLFYFDEARQAWQYQPDPAFGPPADLPPVVTEAVAVRDNLGLAGRGGCLPPATYTLPQKGKEGLWVKEAVQLGHDLAFGKTSVPMWFRKNPGFTNTQFLNGLEHSLVRIVRHRDARENFFPEDMNGVFTELQAFKDCYFICSDSLNRQSFSQADLQAYWERVSVTQERGAVCYVSFYGKQGLLQFYATLVGSTGNDDFNADAVMEEYRRLQTARRNGVEREISRWRQFLSVSPMFQTQEEWCMDASQWFDYVEKNPALMRQRYAGLAQQGLAQHDATAAQAWSEWRERIRQMRFGMAQQSRLKGPAGQQAGGLEYALQVTRFGLHNCDQIFQISDHPQYLMATYQTPEGQPIRPASVAVMDRASRLFFTLPTQSRLLYVPGRPLDIVLSDAAGRSYYLPADAYARLQWDGRSACVLQVEDVTERTRTPLDWARLLEI